VIEVLGEGGDNLGWAGEQVHLTLHREGRQTATFRFDEGGDDVWRSDISYYGQGHVNQVHDFVDSVVEGTRPRRAGEDGIRSVKCSLAAVRSAQEGRPVRVDEIDPEYTAYR
jgi:predicted dehydrogenase